MNDVQAPRKYARGSPPDVVARLRHAIEANDTARVLLSQETSAVARALDLHLDQIDDYLRHLIADIEGRT
jgi:isocitrate lyase